MSMTRTRRRCRARDPRRGQRAEAVQSGGLQPRPGIAGALLEGLFTAEARSDRRRHPARLALERAPRPGPAPAPRIRDPVEARPSRRTGSSLKIDPAFATASARRSVSSRPRRAGRPCARSRAMTRPCGPLTDSFASIDELGVEPVFDLTEAATQHFVANGLLVHNCSEYMFLDDSACNLASINLMKFAGRARRQLRHRGLPARDRSSRWRMEIIVDFATYPTEKIAQNSHDYRPLGLGYANLGTLLMVHGHPLRLERGPRDRRRDHGDPDRPRLRACRPRWRRGRARSRATRRTASRCSR